MNKYTQLNATSFLKSCNIPLAICDLNFDILEVNKVMAKLVEYDRDELIGKNISFVSVDNGLSFNFKQFSKLIAKEIDSYTFKRYYKTKSGKEIYGSITVSLFELHEEQVLLGMFNVDVEEKSTNDFYTESFDTVNKILALNPDIHYIIDTFKRNIVYENVSILNYFGYDESDLNGLNVVAFLNSKIDRDNIHYVKKDSLTINSKNVEGFTEGEYRIKSKNNGWIWIKSRSIELMKKDDLNVSLSYVIIQDITHTKDIESELKFHYEFLEDITNIIPDVVFVFKNKPFYGMYSNLNNRTFLGYSEKEWRNLKEPKPHPDYEEYLLECLKDLNDLKEGDIKIHELPFISKDGEVRWLLSKSKLFRKDEKTGETQILSVVTDVQDYRNAIENLKISQNTNDAIIKAIPDLILVVNKDGIYQNYYSGYDIKIENVNDIIGKHVFDVIPHPAVASQILAHIKNCIANDELISYEFDLKVKNELIYYSNFYSKLNDDQAIILIRDISKRKIAERELGSKIELLSKQNYKLEKFISKNTELERFAYILSHDLKEPLRSISAISTIVNNEIKSLNEPKLNTLMNHLIDSSERMNSMIDGVLEYSKTSNDLINFSTVNTSELVANVLNDLNLLITEKNIKITIDELHNVKGSEIQLRQLFQNLINNAAKFSIVEEPIISIGSKFKGKKVIFYVKDNGIGIQNKFKETVFKMFRRLNSDKDFSGQGLGLPICKKIIDRHNGEIWIEDNKEANTGSVFYFSLPIVNEA